MIVCFPNSGHGVRFAVAAAGLLASAAALCGAELLLLLAAVSSSLQLVQSLLVNLVFLVSIDYKSVTLDFSSVNLYHWVDLPWISI